MGGYVDRTDLDPAAAAIITAYLDRLVRRLPAQGHQRARIMAELRDGLSDAAAARLPYSANPTEAARAAVVEFGDVETVVAAYQPELAAGYARRVAGILLATGPLIGTGWAAAMFLPGAAPGWRWPLLLAAPLVLLGVPAAVLTVAGTGRAGHWLPGTVPQSALATGTVTAAAAVAGDLILLTGTAVVLLGSAAVPPILLAGAVTASVCRLAFVVTSARTFRRRLYLPGISAAG